MIDRDHLARARHVLHDECRIAGDMFAQVFSDESRPEVIQIAGRRPDDDANGFALIEQRLASSLETPRRQAEDQQQNFPHVALPATEKFAATGLSAASRESSRGKPYPKCPGRSREEREELGVRREGKRRRLKREKLF